MWKVTSKMLAFTCLNVIINTNFDARLMYFAVTKLLFAWNKQGTLPIISKIFEQEIFQQLYKYRNLISKFQSIFRPGYYYFCLDSNVRCMVQ